MLVRGKRKAQPVTWQGLKKGVQKSCLLHQ